MPPPLQSPKPTDVVQQILSGARGGVLVAEPGYVLSYDPATQRAVVQPTLHNYYSTTDDTGHAPEFQQPVPNVPVMWPVCSFGGLVGTLAAGDRVIMLVCGRSLDEWKATNAGDIQQQDKRRHSYQDAVAFPLTITALTSAQYADGAMVLSGADVRLGAATATSPVALAPVVDSNNALLVAVLTSISTAATFAFAQAAIVTWLSLSGFPAPTGATKVKAI
jgi:hypothetical protein